MAMRCLTELEGAVPGLVGQHGPCTAYRVRQLFQQSPTSTWRASTGHRAHHPSSDPRQITVESVHERSRVTQSLCNVPEAQLDTERPDPVAS
jgi:hypothetical protein